MITANVLQRTFKIKAGESIGTCFTIDWEGRQYLITARHIVKSLATNTLVSIFHEGKWKDLSVNVVGHGQDSMDISVLSPSIQLSRKELSLPATTAKITLGQDVYFLGFPYGLHSEVGEINRNFPFPLIKRGALSAVVKGDSGEMILLIDGHANPGFSGGPVVFSEIGRPLNELKVAGVISAHRAVLTPIVSAGKKTGLEVYENTGIIISYEIKPALELIKANPIGFPID